VPVSAGLGWPGLGKRAAFLEASLRDVGKYAQSCLALARHAHVSSGLFACKETKHASPLFPHLLGSSAISGRPLPSLPASQPPAKLPAPSLSCCGSCCMQPGVSRCTAPLLSVIKHEVHHDVLVPPFEPSPIQPQFVPWQQKKGVAFWRCDRCCLGVRVLKLGRGIALCQ